MNPRASAILFAIAYFLALVSILIVAGLALCQPSLVMLQFGRTCFRGALIAAIIFMALGFVPSKR